jgi:hypothetical protein
MLPLTLQFDQLFRFTGMMFLPEADEMLIPGIMHLIQKFVEL